MKPSDAHPSLAEVEVEEKGGKKEEKKKEMQRYTVVGCICSADPAFALLIGSAYKASNAATSRTGLGSRLSAALAMGSRSLLALLVALGACQLGTWAAGPSKVNPRIVVTPRGEREYRFPRNEKYPVFYHETNSSSIYVGGEGILYYYNFATTETYLVEFPVENEAQCLKPGSPEDNKNFITLIAKHGNKMLVCGTGACDPTCWHLTEKEKDSPQDGRGLAPFTPDTNSLVIVDYPNIYSTIKKSQQNGKIPRFRRVKGDGELYTSDTVMQNPQFVKATTLRHEEPYQDKIYYFFREDNPDKSPEAPRNISRVAQLCKEDKGGTSSLSASKWTTFLKASLICVDPATKGNFNWLQDVFFVPASNWRDSKVYGLFTNTWGSSAVCVYSFGDIDNVFRTSKLKGYNGPNPEIKPGQCVPSGQHTPSETFKIADSHPEVEERVEPLAPTRSPLFHNKHRYQKIGVHEVSASDGHRYTVLYLATDKGSIHKVVELPGGVHNIMELQVFSKKDPIQTMILDHERAMLYVGSTRKVVEIAMDMCGVYRNNCESCLLARDPYCGWAGGRCQSVYGHREVRQNLDLEPWQGRCQKGEVKEDIYQNITVVPVVPFSRYYLNCPVESHYATYNWYHNDTLIKTCNNTHPQPDCFYFIQNVSHTHYGHYICVSEEDGFRQALVKEHLVNQLRFMSQKGRATMTFASWLQLLLMVALVELFH
ncbi:semaphorin-7A isoform X2 [Cyrtonyx montezumae]|uniref:semaphorin-7A isoform X2 n=1 Tax=Cyrtonyx montezumae TaxID=9017 RepID=UPI0032DB41E9